MKAKQLLIVMLQEVKYQFEVSTVPVAMRYPLYQKMTETASVITTKY